MKRLFALLLPLCLMSPLSACGDSKSVTSSTEAPDPDASAVFVVRPVVNEAEPEMALDKIYESIELSDVKEINLRVLTEELGFDFTQYSLEDYAGRYTSGRYGLANVLMLKPSKKLPATATRDKETASTQPQTPMDFVRNQLQNLKADLTTQASSYDIYDAHTIAENAQIYEQGGYVILLMLPDNEGAREIIDLYIPKT